MPVTIVPYSTSWPEEFKREASLLRDLLGDLVVQIHHVGSTSVPGLAAKPIIDILLEVTDLDDLDARNDGFKKLSYDPKGAYGIPGRRYFRKGAIRRTHHIHAFRSGDTNLERHLSFRDYLIAHPLIAEAYAAVKIRAAQRANNNIEPYSEVKGPFIQQYEQNALEWYRNRKQNLIPCNLFYNSGVTPPTPVPVFFGWPCGLSFSGMV